MKKIAIINSVAAVVPAMVAFENDGGSWKTDADGNIVMKDGNPVFINAAGSEQIVAKDTIANLNSEAAGYRKRAETAEAKLKPFEGLDAEKAKKAIETVVKLDAKKLIDAGEVDKVRDEISKSFNEQIAELTKENGTLKSTVDGLHLDAAFNGSEFVRQNVAIPVEMLRATFGTQFKVEDGKVVPYGADGNRIRSKKMVGEQASFEEGLEIILDGYPHKDAIMKPADASGSGSGGGGGGRGQGLVMKTSEFDNLSPSQQSEAAAKARAGEIQIVD